MVNKSPTTKPKMSNITKATAVGVTAGGSGAALIGWLAAEGEKRYGIPAAVGAGVLGVSFGYVARWAAKLLPDA
jgi:hypothetical protein